jgi:hypothetical protein
MGRAVDGDCAGDCWRLDDEDGAVTDQKFTFDEKRRCAIAEVRMRKRVYPRLVTSGRMTQPEADRGIAMMEEIVSDYAARAEEEAAKGRLI